MSAVLLDIEGTILPISFVAEFPAALHSLPSYVSEHWSSPQGDFKNIKDLFPEEAKASASAFTLYCENLNSHNSKFPPWKTLQGILWRKSYEDGQIKAPLYEDVVPALEELDKMGVRVYIYSSGSIEAQKLLFAHTNQGDIRRHIKDYFDPPSLDVENKFDVQGYQRIISRTGIKNWTFFSDVPKEISSAEKAGMRGYLLVREGNKPLSDAERADTEVITDGLSRIARLLKIKN